MAKKKVLQEKVVKAVMQKKEEIQEIIRPKVSRHLVRIGIIVLCIPIILVGVAFGYKEVHKDKIYPGVYMADYSVSGFTQEDFQSYVADFEDQLARTGLTVLVKGIDGKEEKVTVTIPLVGSTSSLYTKMYMYGRQGTVLDRLLAPWRLLVSPKNVPAPYSVDVEILRKSLKENLVQFEDQPHNASIAVSSITPLNYTVVPEKSGSLFNYDTLLAQIEQKIRAFDTTPLSAQLEHFTPTITSSDAEKITSALPDFLNKGEVVLNYTEDVSHFKKQWRIAKESYAPWLELARNEDGEVVFALVKEKVESYLRKEVSPYIDRVPENAVFRMEADKVVEFKASKSGQGVDIDKTVQDLSNVFVGRSSGAVVTNTVQVAVKIIDPEIKTADVNNLGISDVIGVGISTFKDSHTNRIKNIANAVKRLNGTLIKPGEQFSANKSAGPYTSANGFLPEAVIKGNEIKNEIGGGMCQIGTTLFRMAMNSGMDITERRNHSLVVSYYADPVNGNPGTDATLYEPILDLKFLNDTGNYLLLQTDIDYKRQQLTFTLWGKPDGRSGSYTHPIVHRWLGAGAPQEIEVDTLPPGKKKCQSGFQGAVASFTYTRTTTLGEKIDRVFESYYRPLPRICMVGKAEAPPPCPEGQICAEPVLDTSGGVPTTPIVDSVAPLDPAVSSDPIQ